MNRFLNLTGCGIVGGHVSEAESFFMVDYELLTLKKIMNEPIENYLNEDELLSKANELLREISILVINNIGFLKNQEEQDDVYTVLVDIDPYLIKYIISLLDMYDEIEKSEVERIELAEHSEEHMQLLLKANLIILIPVWNQDKTRIIDSVVLNNI